MSVTPESPGSPERTPATDLAAIPAAVARLRHAFESGRTLPLKWRLEQLAALERMLVENGDAWVEALRQDLGKPFLEAWTTDVAIVKAESERTRKLLRRWVKPERVATPANLRPARSWIVREPLGVALIIAPWNYPIQLLLSPAIGALAAGNAVMLKPSEVSAHCSALLGELVPRYLDPQAVALVEGGVDETSALLEERFDHVFYTGNGRVARVVMAAAARHLTPVTLELGGKSPCIVDVSARMDVAARRIAWGKFLNAGQTCVAPDYVLVHESREAELLERLGEAIRSFYGEDPRRSDDYARIINVGHHRRLAALLKDADVALGGELDEAERYIAPTVVRGVGADDPLMQEEIFGPILPVRAVRDLDEAVAFVRGRSKPLALYVFSEDPRVERRVIDATSSGGVCVNAILWHLSNPHLPFGGVGESGVGAYHGRASFETFSHRRSVLRKPTRFDLKLLYPPYTRWKSRLVRRML